MSVASNGQGVDVRRAFAADASGPVTVVLATARYQPVVDAWIEHAWRVGCRNYRIVCMDLDLLDALREQGDRTMYFWDVLPNACEERIDPPHERAERMEWLTRLRVKLFLHLATHGIDFVHSDADALWLRDPRPMLLENKGFDLLFSQGTTHPWSHFKAFGFTVCAGFFFARASSRTRAYFEMVEQMADRRPSDQFRFNEVLLRLPSRPWKIDAPRLALSPYRSRMVGGRKLMYAPWRYARVPACVHAFGARALRNRQGRFWTHAALLTINRRCMVTSASVMAGRFAGGLNVGVIPMRLVERVPLDDRAEVLVSHVAADGRRLLSDATCRPRPANGR